MGSSGVPARRRLANRRHCQGRVWKINQGKVMGCLDIVFTPTSGIIPSVQGFSVGARLGRIQIYFSDNNFKKLLVDIYWDLNEIANWFVVNNKHIQGERIPGFVEDRGSIFDSIKWVYEYFDRYSDDQLDELFEYRRRHEFCFAVRGVQVPELYMGIGKNGMEVSGEGEGERYVYYVDVCFDEFIEKLINL
ncbi:hypothetical protein [Cupriavidus plantarum]|uniref:hypothetical protein n=1 Tax=Cupriavidus plantarum TaxID=942865 RepID=UPI001BAE1EA5|nr:hypothetical protein [Cupriavidus plantarum]